MSRNLIFSFTKISQDSMIASNRIARFVSETLDIPLVWDSSVGQSGVMPKTLIVVGGAYAFAGSDVLEALGRAIICADRVVWIQNDYTVIPPKDQSGAESPFRKAFRLRHDARKAPVDYWTTCELMARPGVARSGHICGPGSTYINWNCLTVDTRHRMGMSDRMCKDMMIYYGSYRKDRERYFDRYFTTPTIPILISSPTRKFEDRYTNARIKFEIKLGNLNEYVAHFGLGLYIEDKKSHTEYHSVANRFYEMLSAGVPIVFQPECLKTLDKAGYPADDFVVWNCDDLQSAMDRNEQIHNIQQELWLPSAMAERDRLTSQLQEMWRNKYDV